MEHIGHIIKQISDKMRCNADAQLKKHNLTFSQVRVIKFLAQNGNKATQKAIEEHLGVSHPTVVGIVSRMVKSGHLECFADNMDKRNKIVALTNQAQNLDKELRSNIELQEKIILKGLSEREVKELKRMLNIMYNNVRGESQ